MKILFIEDDQHTSELITATLSAHRYAVDAIADGSVGLELATLWSYDLILLDIMIPTLNGIEVCRRLRAQGCQTPILMLTTKDSNDDAIIGLDAGADDYVAKSCASSQLLARVRALLRRGGSTSSSPLLTWGALCLDPAWGMVTYNQQEITLRPKEYSLLELFLRNPQRVLNRSNIIDHLWPMEEAPVEGSVTNLIKDLRQRLKSVGMPTDLIETVYGLGYRLKAAPIGQESRAQPDPVEKPITEARKSLSRPDAVAEVRSEWQVQSWSQQEASVREQRGMVAIQQIAERFQVSLEQRIAVLEAVERSLQTGNFTVQLREVAQQEAHKLAGGLGTFGYVKASELAQAIERLFEPEGACSAYQIAQLLKELKQELVNPLNGTLIGNSSPTSSLIRN